MRERLGARSKIGVAAVLLLALAVAMPATAARKRLTLKKVKAFADARYALKDHTHPEATMQTVLASDGAGSGLDADLLDGRNSSDFDDDAKGRSQDPADPRPSSTFADMIDLSTATGENRLVLTHPSLIMGTASLNFYTASATASEVQCRMTVTPDGGSPEVISQVAQAKFPANSAYDVQVHVTGSTLKGPGTYDLAVQCRESVGDIRYARGDLIGWAI